MKIDTWEVKDELSDDDPSVSADNRPSERDAAMVSKITENDVPKSGIPRETTSFDQSPLVPKPKARARPTRQRSTVLRRLVKDSNPPSPQAAAIYPAPALSGIQEIHNGKILLIQNPIEDDQKTTGALNSPDNRVSKDDPPPLNFSDIAGTQDASLDDIIKDLEKDEGLLIHDLMLSK
tara:strand:+ start:273 stop:806 length:534 start_codon:yes stop_codon:yes gene_type:complete